MARSIGDSLHDIQDAILWLRRYTDGLTFDGFQERHEIQDAVIYRLGVIGEAVRNCLQAGMPLKKRYPDIPWEQVVGFRNRVFHAYWDTRLEIVWSALGELTELERSISEISREIETNDG